MSDSKDIFNKCTAELAPFKIDENVKMVYHYTNAIGLKSILESGKIFATDCRFLNDKSEIIHGTERSHILCQSMMQRNPKSTLSNFLRSVLRYIKSPDENRTFVCSFSSRRDDLSQWRGYASDGEGFTIGISTSKLREIAQPAESPIDFGKVSYNQREFEKNISDIVNIFHDALQAGNYDLKEADDFAGWCEAAIGTACAYHKHSSFMSEREWRLVEYTSNDEKKILVRTRGNYLVPYIEIELKDKEGRLPIDEIGIGPGFRNSLTRSSIEDLCALNDLKLKIYDANTPYSRV